jgi:hypothetical protein
LDGIGQRLDDRFHETGSHGTDDLFADSPFGFDRTRNGIMARWRQAVELAMTDLPPEADIGQFYSIIIDLHLRLFTWILSGAAPRQSSQLRGVAIGSLSIPISSHGPEAGWQLCGRQRTDQADASSLVTGALVGSSAPLEVREAGNCSTVAR